MKFRLRSLHSFAGLLLLLLCGCVSVSREGKARGDARPTTATARGDARPTTVTVAWTASPSPEVTGYVLYYRSAETTNRVDVGAVLTHAISNLVAGTTYTFHATAYNADAVESEDSNLVEYTPPPPPPLPPEDLHIVITPQASDSLNGPWLAVESWPAITLTNPVGQRFYRYDITQTQKNP